MALILADKLVSTKLWLTVIINTSVFKKMDVKCHFFNDCMVAFMLQVFFFMNSGFLWGYASVCVTSTLL